MSRRETDHGREAFINCRSLTDFSQQARLSKYSPKRVWLAVFANLLSFRTGLESEATSMGHGTPPPLSVIPAAVLESVLAGVMTMRSGHLFLGMFFTAGAMLLFYCLESV